MEKPSHFFFFLVLNLFLFGNIERQIGMLELLGVKRKKNINAKKVCVYVEQFK